MNLNQAFKIAAKSIAAKKGRSALTMLGVIIGLAAVIILVSYAQGQNQQMRAYYESLGTNVINIEASSWNSQNISDALYNYCMELDEYVLGVTPNIQMYNQTVVKYGAKTLDNYQTSWEESPQVVMGNQQFALCNNLTVAKGRDLSYLDIQKYSQVWRAGLQNGQHALQLRRPHRQDDHHQRNALRGGGRVRREGPQQLQRRGPLYPGALHHDAPAQQQHLLEFLCGQGEGFRLHHRAITLLDGFLKGLIGENGYYYVQTPNQWQEQGEAQDKLQQRFLAASQPSPWRWAASAS